MGWTSAYGGSPVASSIAVMPNDQISAYNKVMEGVLCECMHQISAYNNRTIITVHEGNNA